MTDLQRIATAMNLNGTMVDALEVKKALRLIGKRPEEERDVLTGALGLDGAPIQLSKSSRDKAVA